MIIPVSVCHHVSTTGVRSPPMCCRYHIQASGLIGSPTVPSSRSDERSCFAACSGPHFMCARIAVGAVYRIVTLVALDDLPPAVLVREVGRALVEDARRAVAQRPVDDVAVTRDPADVGGAPVDVASRASGRRRSGASTPTPDEVAGRSCARCPSASRSCRSCTGGRVDPPRPSARGGHDAGSSDCPSTSSFHVRSRPSRHRHLAASSAVRRRPSGRPAPSRAPRPRSLERHRLSRAASSRPA